MNYEGQIRSRLWPRRVVIGYCSGGRQAYLAACTGAVSRARAVDGWKRVFAFFDKHLRK